MINALYARALERGFDTERRPLTITEAHVADAPRTGRPKEPASEILAEVRLDRYYR